MRIVVEMQTLNLADLLPWKVIDKEDLTPAESMNLKEEIGKVLENLMVCRPEGFTHIYLCGPPASAKVRQTCHVMSGLYGWKHKSTTEHGVRVLRMTPPSTPSGVIGVDAPTTVATMSAAEAELFWRPVMEMDSPPESPRPKKLVAKPKTTPAKEENARSEKREKKERKEKKQRKKDSKEKKAKSEKKEKNERTRKGS